MSRERSTPEEVAERHKVILGMMTDCTWVRGESAIPLAKLWGVAISTVEGYAAQVSRVVHSKIDRDLVRARIAGALDQGIGVLEREMGTPDKCPECGRSDLAAVAILPRVADSYSGLVGAAPAKEAGIQIVLAHPLARELMAHLHDGYEAIQARLDAGETVQVSEFMADHVAAFTERGAGVRRLGQ